MQRATLGRAGATLARAALRQFASYKVDSESIFQQRFGEYHGDDGCFQYILTAAQSLGSQDYYKKSRMTILGLAGVLFCENEQTDKMDYCMFRRKYLLGCSGKLGEASTEQ